MKTPLAVLLRFGLALIIGVTAGWVISEVSYQTTKDSNKRDQAGSVEIIIPAGTAARIAAGEDALSLPPKMTFVVGDLLIVRNQDSVSHQLGPVWVPAQSSGVLEMGSASSYIYACSFEVDKVLGIDVLPSLTLGMRIQGALTIGMPSAVMIGLYSFLIFPLKQKNRAAV